MPPDQSNFIFLLCMVVIAGCVLVAAISDSVNL